LCCLILSPSLCVSHVQQDLIAQNIYDVCFNSTVGVDDLLCQAIEENSFIDLVEATTFPVTICHSPDDELVSIGNAPNISANPLLSNMTLLGTGVNGSHFDALVFCYMTQVLQFSSFGSSPTPLTGIEALADPSKCNNSTTTAQPAAPNVASPTTSNPGPSAASPSVAPATTPTNRPTTPSSNAGAGSGFSLHAVAWVLVSSYWLATSIVTTILG
jgi:hypothetical protein